MNEKDLLKSVGNIDEKFINDADVKIEKRNTANKKRAWKIAGSLAACFVLVVAAGSVLIGSHMFKAGNSYEDAATMEMAPMAAEDMEEAYGGYVVNAGDGGMASLTKEKAAVNGAANVMYEAEEGEVYNGEARTGANKESKEPIKQEVKLIYRASVNIQTTKFGEEVDKVKARVEEFGGYIENMNEYNGGYYDNSSYKEGNFTVRIPKDKYRAFLDGITENSHVTNISENVEDVGEQYFDIESRLNMLKTKEERLQALLKKADKLSDIIEIESSLTEVQYQIDMYQSNLNHYDSLIDYSTVDIYISQVAHVGEGLAGENNFLARLGRNFLNGLHGFVKKIDNFVMWISYNVITLGIIAVVVIIIWRFHLIRKILQHIKR